MNKLRIIIILYFTSISGLYSQIQWDTLPNNYVWKFSDSLDVRNDVDNYTMISKAEREYQTSMVKYLFKKLEYPPDESFDDFYTLSSLLEIMNGILAADEILIDRQADIYEIKYGYFSGTDFGLQRVTVYSHISIDIRKKKIVPGISVSFIY